MAPYFTLYLELRNNQKSSLKVFYEEIMFYLSNERANFALFPESHCVSTFTVDALSPTTFLELGITYICAFVVALRHPSPQAHPYPSLSVSSKEIKQNHKTNNL